MGLSRYGEADPHLVIAEQGQTDHQSIPIAASIALFQTLVMRDRPPAEVMWHVSFLKYRKLMAVTCCISLYFSWPRSWWLVWKNKCTAYLKLTWRLKPAWISSFHICVHVVHKIVFSCSLTCSAHLCENNPTSNTNSYSQFLSCS